MNTLLWVLQILAALLYGASGVMKAFMFDKISTPTTPSPPGGSGGTEFRHR